MISRSSFYAARIVNCRDRNYGNSLIKAAQLDSAAEVVQKNDGSMTTEDLGAYNVTIDHPEYVKYGDVTVRTQPLPSSGGLTIAHILELVELLNISQYDRQSVETALSS